METNRRLGLHFPWLAGEHWLCLGPVLFSLGATIEAAPASKSRLCMSPCMTMGLSSPPPPPNSPNSSPGKTTRRKRSCWGSNWTRITRKTLSRQGGERLEFGFKIAPPPCRPRGPCPKPLAKKVQRDQKSSLSRRWSRRRIFLGSGVARVSVENSLSKHCVCRAFRRSAGDGRRSAVSLGGVARRGCSARLLGG